MSEERSYCWGSLAFDALAHYSMAQVIFGLYQAGVWAPFEADPDYVFEPAAFSESRALDARLLTAAAEYLARRGVFERVGEVGGIGREQAGGFRLAREGRVLVEDGWLPFFVFYVGGYGNVLSSIGRMLHGDARYGVDLVRDGAYVALGTELAARTRHAGSHEAVLRRTTELRPRTVLDVGCGSAGFLIELVRRSSAERGVGIDSSKAACELARRQIAAGGLTSTIEIVDGDARDVLRLRPDLIGSVDVVTALFVIHELLGGGASAAAAALADIARSLQPESGRILVMDKHTDVLVAGGAPGYFTEFKLVHDFTQQVLCTRQQWHEVFDAAKLEIVREEALAPHTGSILFECRLRG